MSTPLPNPKDVKDMLEGLLGRDVTVGIGKPVASGQDEPTCIGVFVDDRTTMLGLCIVDLPLSGAMGGALGLMPPGGVEDMVAEKDLSKMVLDNVYEVVNILSALLNVEGAPHAKLYVLHLPGEVLPNDVAAQAAALGNRLDLDVEVAGYGKGSMSLVLTL